MKFTFYKYQGTGNDFIAIDNRTLFFDKSDNDFIQKICHRKFGIGADGLLLLENHEALDFTMVYYNSDGRESTMCGNGGRCLVRFASDLAIVKNTAIFEAVDGIHSASVLENGMISLKMNDVDNILVENDYTFLNTGSPHHVLMVDNLDTLDIKTLGAELRYGLYGKEGANINFVSQVAEDLFNVRTYERGVEDETLSCGTGVTAVALSMHKIGLSKNNNLSLQTPGGVLYVSFLENETGYKEVFLTGPAIQVFKGAWND